MKWIKNRKLSRRDFFKAAGAAGVSSAIASMSPPAFGADKPASSGFVPTRRFGRTGVEVPILSLGGMFDIASNQLLLRQAVKMGVTFWDTAAIYPPSSEKGIGRYFAKHPEDRKKIFLVTKSALTDPAGWDYHLEKSLENMNTAYVDLFLVHDLHSIEKIAPLERTRAWVEKRKAAGKFKLFGFSAHKNMAASMIAGAELGWIDGMMITYNYRNLHTETMKKAVAACVAAGVGLIAMKTQAAGAISDIGTETPAAIQLADKFIEKGFTPEQARLKAVWENPNIASICSQMPNMTLLKANVAAASDRRRLSSNEKTLMQQYADETKSQYCAGCDRICQAAVAGDVPIFDVMRCLMYSRSYGDHQSARSLFNEITAINRHQMANADYAEAERRCPQHLPIGALIAEAVDELA